MTFAAMLHAMLHAMRARASKATIVYVCELELEPREHSKFRRKRAARRDGVTGPGDTFWGRAFRRAPGSAYHADLIVSAAVSRHVFGVVWQRPMNPTPSGEPTNNPKRKGAH